jgi:diguanylate cyclase (GGDEF)-like protein
VNVTDKRSPGSTVFTDFDLKILLYIVRQSAVAVENAELYKELKYLTVTDPLTNLYNYRHFMRTLDYEIGRFHRFGDPLSLLIMDVDDFKAYNETHGAARGDEILKAIGNILSKHLREVDIICRYASDEFAVILPATDVAEAKTIARKIAEAAAHLDPAEKITASFGLASCHKGMTRHDFILKADAALTHAKRHGKDQIYCQEKHNAG